MENNNLCWCGLLATCRTSWTMDNPARRFLGCPNYLDPNLNCNYFRWVDCELPNQWYQRRMYLLHSNVRTVQNDLRVAQNILRAAQDDLRAAQDNLRAAQDELVQVNAERGRVAFFNKVLMLLVVAMVLIKFM
ncbi:zinc finger, GRF-type containing protein [Tanacetum coccineum]|uniref:Zinc finger, GRF-type containing protein n=1 Tax=Tanacetum coccineum TaxID=301880 RepID=A0ABQ5IBU4_9ASTR